MDLIIMDWIWRMEVVVAPGRYNDEKISEIIWLQSILELSYLGSRRYKGFLLFVCFFMIIIP